MIMTHLALTFICPIGILSQAQIFKGVEPVTVPSWKHEFPFYQWSQVTLGPDHTHIEDHLGTPGLGSDADAT